MGHCPLNKLDKIGTRPIKFYIDFTVEEGASKVCMYVNQYGKSLKYLICTKEQ